MYDTVHRAFINRYTHIVRIRREEDLLSSYLSTYVRRLGLDVRGGDQGLRRLGLDVRGGVGRLYDQGCGDIRFVLVHELRDAPASIYVGLAPTQFVAHLIEIIGD